MRNQGILRALCVAASFLLLVASGCSTPPDDTLQRVLESGRLVLITDNNANTYYNYRGESRGFEYDLARAFAEEMEVELEVKTPGWDELFSALEKGAGDLVAAGLTITDSRAQRVDFSDPYLEVQQQVVLHKDDRSIRSIEDLAGKIIHVRPGTSYAERLGELQNGGLDLQVRHHTNVPTEELIRRVAEGEIQVTVADSNIVLLNRRYYPEVQAGFPIEEPQSLGWAVRKGDRRFLQAVNRFLEEAQDNGTFARIYERYYAQVEIFDYVDLAKFHQRLESRLPKYKNLIQREARKYGFDWRLIAAAIYQESHFDPRARSYTGVRGLMQVTLRTAREMGITNRLDPEQSVEAGVKYLAEMHQRFDEVETPRDRMLLALASYNVGYGHVRDAQAIARDKGWDADTWAGTKKALPLLRERKYYSQTRYGYARGTEPVRYVGRILTYFDILKRRAHD